MFHSDKNMRKIKRSKKPFEGRKAPWNKGLSIKKNTKKNISSHKEKKFKQLQYIKVVV